MLIQSKILRWGDDPGSSSGYNAVVQKEAGVSVREGCVTTEAEVGVMWAVSQEVRLLWKLEEAEVGRCHLPEPPAAQPANPR